MYMKTHNTERGLGGLGDGVLFKLGNQGGFQEKVALLLDLEKGR